MAASFTVEYTPEEQSTPWSDFIGAAYQQWPEGQLNFGSSYVWHEDRQVQKLSLFTAEDPITQEELDAFIEDARTRWPSLF